MISVDGAKVKVSGYKINIQVEFAELCHRLMFDMGFDQDELMYPLAMASIPDEQLLDRHDEAQLGDILKANPDFVKILEDLMGEGYCERKGLV